MGSIDFTESKHNAKMLIERFLETGEQPDFMEFLCFKHCFVEAKFYGYSLDYVINNFCIYSGITITKELKLRGSNKRFEIINTVEHCYCPCKGEDLIEYAKRSNIDFILKNGSLQLIKATNPKVLNIDNLEYAIVI